MILKYFELSKINLEKNNILLFYGKNEGLKKESIKLFLKESNNITRLDEREVLENSNTFMENILTKSLFENERIIIIKRVTDKILNILNQINTENLNDIKIIIEAENLDKKSKLRAFFEKSKKHICVAFYPDNKQTLSKLSLDFLKKENISISQSNINLIVNKCNGDREVLINELNKIGLFCKNGKKISFESISKLINLSENYDISVLIDNCLAKNQKKTIIILNENNFNSDDCMMIIKIFLNKAKRILKLSLDFEKNNNIDLTISKAKPPIFWKDKEITKQQIYMWKPKNIKKLIYNLNEIELLIKKNFNNSLNILTNFLLEQSSSRY